jgi:hypothetical protein
MRIGIIGAGHISATLAERDADLPWPIEVVTDMSKSRRLGFTAYQPTDDAFFDLFAELRSDRLIPGSLPCDQVTIAAERRDHGLLPVWVGRAAYGTEPK